MATRPRSLITCAAVNLLVDYGEVISRPQAAAAIAELAALADLADEVFLRRYWDHRVAYDAGEPTGDYWAAVLGRTPAPAELEELVRRDVESWLSVDEEALGVLREAHERGARMTLLSNAPHELADVVAAMPALSFFDHMVFSARIGVTKPEPAAFQAALEVMGLPAAEVIFVDDREANIEGARRVGLDGRLYTNAAALRSDLLG